MSETLTEVCSSIGDDYSYYGQSSSYPITNPLGSSAEDGTKYGGVNLTRNSGGITYFYVKFDLSAIPNNASIESVTANIKLYGSTNLTSRTTTREVQLYSGSNPKGDSESFTLSGTSAIYSLNGGSDWTRDEVLDAGIRVYVVRNSSNTTSNTYLYWLGADITVTYTEDSGIIYTVTVQGQNVVSDQIGENFVKENSSFRLVVTDGDINSATDNGNDISKSFIKESQQTDGAITSYPVSYTTSGSIRGTNYQNAVGKGSSNTASGNDYASSSGSTATIIYAFDFSAIPNNATIKSVSVTVGGHCESTSNSQAKSDLQLYSGNISKGSSSSFTSTSKQIIEMNSGSWTRAELQEAKLYFTIGYYGGLVNGCDFVVSYTIPGNDYIYTYTISSVTEDHTILINYGSSGPSLYFKINGSWVRVSSVYKKNNGSWEKVNINDLDTEVKYVYSSV